MSPLQLIVQAHETLETDRYAQHILSAAPPILQEWRLWPQYTVHVLQRRPLPNTFQTFFALP